MRSVVPNNLLGATASTRQSFSPCLPNIEGWIISKLLMCRHIVCCLIVTVAMYPRSICSIAVDWFQVSHVALNIHDEPPKAASIWTITRKVTLLAIYDVLCMPPPKI